MSESSNAVFAPGEEIFGAGQGCDAFYIITEGQVEIQKVNANGEKAAIAILKSGDFLGEIALLRGTTHTSSAVALTEVKLAKVTKKVLDGHLAKTPAVIKALVNQLVDRLQRTNEIVRSHNVKDEKIESAVKTIESKSSEPSD